MKKTWIRMGLVVLLLALAGLGWAALRARADRVTLDVRETPVETVVRSLRWQTWETIWLLPGATNRITLNVRNVPLTEALGLISDQAECQWTTIYPLYTSRRSMRDLEHTLLEATPAGRQNWTNLLHRAPRTAGAAFAQNVNQSDGTVTLSRKNRAATEVAETLSRFGRARVVPEDGLVRHLDVQFAGIPFEEAVDRLARMLRCKWTTLHVLKPHFTATRAMTPDELKGASSAEAPQGDKMVSLPFPSGGKKLELSQPQGEPPSASEVEQRMNQQLRESLRNSTPEQRAEKWRRLLREPPPSPEEQQ